MSTPARRHFLRATAATATAAAAPGEPVNATAYELVLVQLAEDKRKLKALQSIERRIEAKRAMLPAYQPWIDGALAGGAGAQDAVLMTMLVWKIDVGDIDGALDIAAYAIPHDLAMPDQFKRDLPTLVTEEVAEFALREIAGGRQAPADALDRVTDIVGPDRDMPDEVRAKLFKAIGLGLEQVISAEGAAAEPDYADSCEQALAALRRAVELHDKVGVKKDIERIERFIKNNPPKPSNAAEPPAAGDQAPAPGDPAAGAAATGE